MNMSRAYLLFSWFLLWMSPLLAQGWERTIDLTAGFGEQVLSILPLPDGGSIITTDRGQLVTLDAQGRKTREVSSGNGGGVNRMVFDDGSVRTYYRAAVSATFVGFVEERFTPKLKSFGTNITRLETLDGSHSLFREGIFLPQADGGLTYVVSTRNPAFTNTEDSADSLRVYRMDSARNVVEQLTTGFGETFALGDAFLLEDGGVGLEMVIDTTYDGDPGSANKLAASVYLSPEGEFTLHSATRDAASTFRNQTAATQISGEEAMLFRDTEIPGFYGVQRINYLTGEASPPRFIFGAPGHSFPKQVHYDGNGYVVLSTGLEFDPRFGLNFLTLTRFNAEFEIEWTHNYGVPFSSVDQAILEPTPDGGYLLSAIVIGGDIPHLIVRVDANGVSFPNELRGNLLQTTEECTPQVAGPSLNRWWLRLVSQGGNRDTLYAYTRANGFYETRIDTGTYEVQPVPPNAYWGTCPGQIVRITEQQQTVTFNPVAKPIYDCGLLTVGISAGGDLARCEEETYVVTFQNRGTIVSDSSLLRITLDSLFTPTQSVPAWDQRVGDTLFYNVDPVEVWQQGRVVITGELACEDTAPRQTHCTEVQIFPDSLCTPPGIDWDGSSIELSGRCDGDSVYFELRNVSPNDMVQPRSYVVIEDIVLHLGGEFQLPGLGSEIIALPANGKTYTMLAEQSAGHPGNSNPIASVEGCGADTFDDWSFGEIGQYARDDGDPFISISCEQNDGAAPDGLVSGPEGGTPNKNARGAVDSLTALYCWVSPTGIGPQNLIDTGTVLKYALAYRNTTPDTLEDLLIIDTLSGALDVSTVVPGPGTEPYGFSVDPFGVLRFSITGLRFPPGADGFVQFSVRPKNDVRPGTLIRNRGSISQGSRELITSNFTELRVRRPQRYAATNSRQCYSDREDLPALLRRLDTLRLGGYDSVTLDLERQLPAYAIAFDTTVRQGDTLWGMEILEDTELVRSLKTAAGCDSVLTVRVTADLTSVTDFGSASMLVYPNPATEYAILRLPQGERITTVRLTDMLGRTREVRIGPDRSGNILIDLRSLARGTYVVDVRTAFGRQWRKKMVISR